MPHPEREHELMIEVARLRRETERLGSACVAWGARVDELDAALAAARREVALLKRRLDFNAHAPDVAPDESCCDACDRALAAPGDGEEGTR